MGGGSACGSVSELIEDENCCTKEHFWSALKCSLIFTDLALRPIQSSICDVRIAVNPGSSSGLNEVFARVSTSAEWSLDRGWS